MGVTTNYGFPYPSSTDPIRVSKDMENLATKIDDRLLLDSARNGSSLVLAEAFDATQSLIEIRNTAVATQYLSVPITGASAGALYILDFGGSYQNNTGANRTLGMDIKIGSSTLFTGTSPAIATSTGLRSIQGQIRLHIDTTTANVAMSHIIIGGVGQFSMNTAATIWTYAVGSSTEDLSTTKNLTIDITHSIASEFLLASLQFYRLMRLT